MYNQSKRMTDTCMGPYTSERSNMRMKYSRFLTADSQGRNSVSFVRKRVEFRARVTLTSLALRRTRVRSQLVQPFIQNSQKRHPYWSIHTPPVFKPFVFIKPPIGLLLQSHFLTAKCYEKIKSPRFGWDVFG